jgi:hypothetical protein
MQVQVAVICLSLVMDVDSPGLMRDCIRGGSVRGRQLGNGGPGERAGPRFCQPESARGMAGCEGKEVLRSPLLRQGRLTEDECYFPFRATEV